MPTPATLILQWRSVAADPPPARINVFVLFQNHDLIAIIPAFHHGDPAKPWHLADGQKIPPPDWWSPYQFFI